MIMSPARRALGVLALAGACLALTRPAEACTAFRLDQGGESLVGKNYDWSVDAGLVLVNKRGVTKSFELRAGEGIPAWTSRYGSVTFNQYGRDLPQGGINEQGLVVEILWLAGTEFPPPDDRPELGTTQWIQYQLDTAANVPEVIASLDRVRIRSQIEVHFFVADRAGRSAAVEFLDGELVCHTGESMPAPTLTNHSYETSASYLRRHEGWGGGAEFPQTSGSLDRFVRASSLARLYAAEVHENPVAHVFEVLDEVAQGHATKWTIVYDLPKMQVHFRTQRARSIKTLDLAGLDFDCEGPVMMADINLERGGDLASRWSPYTRAANLELVTESYRSTGFLKDVSDETLERLADYPEQSFCAPRP